MTKPAIPFLWDVNKVISTFFLLVLVTTVLPLSEVLAQKVPADDAKAFAEKFLSSHISPLEKSPLSLSTIYQSADSVIHPVYCFQNDKSGYVIVSETDGNYYILGYSETGKLSSGNLPDVLKSFLKSYEQIKNITSQPQTNLKGGAVIVQPLLDKAGINLNQYPHENVGNCPSGCVATALAQIMCYYKYPNKGLGSHCYTHPVYGQLCANFENTTYNWTNPTNDDYKLLSYHLGIAMDMNYCGSSSGSSPSASNYINVLQTNFKYALNNGSSESFFIKNELNNNRPVYCELPGDPGHAVVVDGYDAEGYFHINFGWGGSYNGYFILNSNSTMNVGFTFGTNVSRAAFITPSPLKTDPKDSLALVVFHNSMKAKTGWDLTKPVVNWPGVLVMNGRVIGIKINNALEGTIPAEIGDLTALQQFNIKGVITGSFPIALTTLTSLKELSIDYFFNSTKVSLPTEIGNLTNLEILNIPAGGTIPKTIGNLTKLRFLSLSGGGLTGQIPDEMYSLTALENLILSNNQLTGSLSSKIGQLTNLKMLWLHKNQLSGSLPVEIGNLGNLIDFYIAENQFSGAIPETIGNWKNLVNLTINNNSFEGMLPNAIGKFTKFTNLIINNNKFSALPDSIGSLSNLQEIVAHHNLISAIPPTLSKLNKLYRLDLMNNKLTTFPDIGTMPGLWDLNLSNNQLSELPESFCKLAKISVLYLDSNKLTVLPSSFDKLSTLTELSINDNKLGFVPLSFSLLSNLKHLYLKNNQISGALPPLSHLGLLDFNIRLNKLTFADIAASKMPDDTIYTDTYEFNYYDQAKVPVSDSIFVLAEGDSVVIDVCAISKVDHPANVYAWYKGGQLFQNGRLLKFSRYTNSQSGKYTCRITNTRYKKLLTLETYPISVLNDSLSKDGLITTSRLNIGQQFSDRQVTMVVPDEVRGEFTWQASVDSVTWYNVTENMSQSTIKQNIKSITKNKIVVEPKSAVLFRYAVNEGTCKPLFSDTIRINPYSRLLLDTVLNVKNKNVTIQKDSIEIIFPANFTDKDFRLTIEKLLHPPASADSMKLSSVYDVNVSCGSIFEIPLQIKFKNINKKAFNVKDIDRYKPVYFDDKTQKWVVYDNGNIQLKDSSIVFNTKHLTKLAWFEMAHGSYTHIYTFGRVNVIYKYGVGGGEEIFYSAYEIDIKKQPTEWWQNTNTNPDVGGNPYMIQDIAEYANEVINKFESLGLEVPSLRFNIYVGCINSKAAGKIGFESYLAGRGYFYINPTYASDRASLKTTIAHEYMHYTQDYYMVMLTHNYFWQEATAPLADRLVWNETEQVNAEPELLLKETRSPNQDGKSIFDILSNSWDNYTNIPLLSKYLINTNDANLASTFLHYMRSYRTGDKLKPEVLLKETSYFGSWLNYLDSYIQTYLKSNVGDEFDGFVRYILEGSNPKYTLLNQKEGEDPLKYFQNPSNFISNRVYKFNNQKLIKDSVQLEVPYLSAKMVQIFNVNYQRMVVRYKRKNAEQANMKVYVAKYDSKTKKMTFEDISDVDSSAFIIEKPNAEKKHIAYLLFVNKDKSQSFKQNYELKMYNIPEFSMFDNFGFTSGYGTTQLKIHSISNGTSETLDEIYMMPSVFRVYAYQYYSPMSYESEIDDSTLVVHAWSQHIEQTITYNYLTGRMVINDKEDWGGKNNTPPIDKRELTIVLENVWLESLPPNQYGITYTFRTSNTAETQKVVKSISYTRKHATWNDSLTPPGYNPTVTYTYIQTIYNTPDIKFSMQFY